ncbi:hypothetical protein E4U41_004506 [Claviceps citrina]|nr:hypothetical protein E4U41_004506 [Claviceps citrina]
MTVQLQFGRFYLTDLKSADVDVMNRPHRKMEHLLRELEAFQQESIGFSTILSEMRSDVDLLVNYPTSPWVSLGEDRAYEIQCTLDGRQYSIDIDAETFEFECHGPRTELGCTLVHCVHQSWDLKLAVNHSTNRNTSPRHMSIGQAITNSLQVSTGTKGDGQVFALAANPELGVIETVRIRHRTRYKSTQTPDSVLSVVRYQTLQPGNVESKRCRWRIPKNASQKGPSPQAWFEAYVSSSTLDALLRENAKLSLGERLSWDASQQEDICDGLFEPALGTVAQLNEVGNWNDNGLSDGKPELNESAPEKFW